jgi:sugar lactone lactonase YvrE
MCGILPVIGGVWNAAAAQTAHFAGAQSVVASSGLSNPQGVAVDGSGNVYIADVNNYRVVKIPWTGGAYGELVTLADRTTNGSLFEPLGVAVDGSGNVYIANLGEGNGNVLKIPWTGSAYGPQVTLIDFSQAASEGLYFPTSVAVDGAGNVYIGWDLR